MSNARGSNGFGANAIGWRDIAAWSALRGVTLTQFELDCVMAIDLVYLNARAEAVRDKKAAQ